jgi:hypothetical protein
LVLRGGIQTKALPGDACPPKNLKGGTPRVIEISVKTANLWCYFPLRKRSFQGGKRGGI